MLFGKRNTALAIEPDEFSIDIKDELRLPAADLPSFEFHEDPKISILNPSDYVCVFEPIYERNGDYLDVAGHKASLRTDIQNRLEDDRFEVPLSVALARGASQPEIIEQQFRTFAGQYRSGDVICLEFCPGGSEENDAALLALDRLINRANRLGVPRDSFVLELRCSPELDASALCALATQLRALDLKIALTDFDADCATLNRIMQIAPFSVKFNRSWLHYGKSNPNYLGLVRRMVATFKDTGLITVFTGVECDSDLAYVWQCGFDRFQGPYFGKSAEVLERSQIYCGEWGSAPGGARENVVDLTG